MNINEKIRNVMAQKGVSYVELSEKTGIAKSSLHGYANGRSKRVPLSVIQKITKALNVPVEYWLDTEMVSPIKEDTHIEQVSEEYHDLLGRLAESSPEQVPVRNFMAELMDLVNLYEKGLLTDEEFSAGKRFIMQMTLKDEN